MCTANEQEQGGAMLNQRAVNETITRLNFRPSDVRATLAFWESGLDVPTNPNTDRIIATYSALARGAQRESAAQPMPIAQPRQRPNVALWVALFIFIVVPGLFILSLPKLRLALAEARANDVPTLDLPAMNVGSGNVTIAEEAPPAPVTDNVTSGGSIIEAPAYVPMPTADLSTLEAIAEEYGVEPGRVKDANDSAVKAAPEPETLLVPIEPTFVPTAIPVVEVAVPVVPTLAPAIQSLDSYGHLSAAEQVAEASLAATPTALVPTATPVPTLPPPPPTVNAAMQSLSGYGALSAGESAAVEAANGD